MNLTNLQRMVEHIKTVPKHLINMESYREDNDEGQAECKTIGCIIGHSVVLAPGNIPRKLSGAIYYTAWEANFTETNDEEWDFLFSEKWQDIGDTRDEFVNRANFLINGGSVQNWQGKSAY